MRWNELERKDIGKRHRKLERERKTERQDGETEQMNEREKMNAFGLTGLDTGTHPCRVHRSNMRGLPPRISQP